MVSSGISFIAFASVYSDKTRLKLMMMKMIIIIIIIIMNKSQETTVFSRCQKLTEARKVMVDFKFDGKSSWRASISWVSRKLFRSLYWWVELCVPTLHRDCYHTLILTPSSCTWGNNIAMKEIKHSKVVIMIINSTRKRFYHKYVFF